MLNSLKINMGNLCCCKDTPTITLSCDNNEMVNSCCAGEGGPKEGENYKLYKWVYTIRHGQQVYRYEGPGWYTSFNVCQEQARHNVKVWPTNPDSETLIRIVEWEVSTATPERVVSKRRLHGADHVTYNPKNNV